MKKEEIPTKCVPKKKKAQNNDIPNKCVPKKKG